MKKINTRGFVLAETLVVTIFLMVIFTMLYSYFYPLIGEYEKRETYDDVDSIYSIYWIKRMIEDSSYSLDYEATDLRAETKRAKRKRFERYGYLRFECSDVSAEDEKRETCKNLVKSLQVANCDKNGDGCEIFITKYRIGGTTNAFKNSVKENLYKYEEECRLDYNLPACFSDTLTICKNDYPELGEEGCREKLDTIVFDDGFKDYILSLPDYSASSLNNAKYRVTAIFKHTQDNNNYYSYATIEVNK